MAAEFLKTHGIDIQDEMSNIQFSFTISPNSHANQTSDIPTSDPRKARISYRKINKILNVKLPCRDPDETWDVFIHNDTIASLEPHNPPSHDTTSDPQVLNGGKAFLLPSLCHPHIHLDKCFLLSDPKYSDLSIEKGDFREALSLTSQAKSRFTPDDLLRRGRWLIEESIAAGVTCMRAFVEVDATVRFKCLEAGLMLKQQYQNACDIQICAFAQDPLFSGETAAEGRVLMEQAVQEDGVDVVGSTPYVEADEMQVRENIDWAVDFAIKYGKHLDLHLDYNLDGSKEPMVHYVIDALKKRSWTQNKNTVLGHCTRLTLLTSDQWYDLNRRIWELPISFVGLPTSDLFMMGRPSEPKEGSERVRGTLQIPQLIKEYYLQGTIGINNVGNAFTPQGSCDPVSLASMCVGVYQAGAKEDVELLYECISTRAKAAIGSGERCTLEVREGDKADLVLVSTNAYEGGRPRRTLQELVYDPPKERRVMRMGHMVHLETG